MKLASIIRMVLEAIDGEAYRPQMELIVEFLVRTQRTNGAWWYNYSD